MLDMVEICRRCGDGPLMKEKEFDIQVVFSKMKEVIRKYEIKCDPQNPVPDDDELADRVFEAAVDFLVEVGGYCTDTKRVIEFDRAEVLEVIEKGHPKCKAGQGDDTRIWVSRKPDQPDRPWCHIGSGILSSTEELAVKAVEGYCRIARADSVAIPALNSYRGTPIEPKHPLEIKSVIQSTRLAREALSRMGRPGLAMLNGVPTSGSAQGTIASCNPLFGMGPSDGWLIPVYAEMKVPFESLAKVAFLQELGGNYAVSSSAMLGGYVGGPEGVAIASTAYVFLSALVFQTNYHCNFPITLLDTISSSRLMLWAISVSSQAMARNTTMPIFNIGFMGNGPATENYFYEAAAYIVSSVASGVTAQTPYPAKGVVPDGMTPMEALFHTELTDTATGVKRHQANEIVLKLVDKYEKSLQNPEKGRTYPECFDIQANKPDEAYSRLYDKVKAELSKLGLDVK